MKVVKLFSLRVSPLSPMRGGSYISSQGFSCPYFCVSYLFDFFPDSDHMAPIPLSLASRKLNPPSFQGAYISLIPIPYCLCTSLTWLLGFPPKLCVPAQSLSCVQLFATQWTVAHRLLCSWDFSGKKEYWSGLLFCTARDLPSPGIKTASLALPEDFSPLRLGSGKGSYLGSPSTQTG